MKFSLLLIYYNSKNLNCFGALFFLRSVHTFSWFLKSNCSSDFGHAETGSGAKKRFCGVKIFCSNFKVEWESRARKFAFWLLVFCSHAAISLWFLLFFFRFFGLDFFLNGLPNPFIVHSSPSFLFQPNFHFLLVVFCSTCGIFTLIFCFFIFWSDVFRNCFSNSLIVRSRSSFCLVNENFLTCTSGLVLLCFFKDLFTHFHDFWIQLGVVFLVTPKQEVERKSECICDVKCFCSNFKESENGVWTKIRFLAVVFCSHAAISLWFLPFFSIFSIGFFSKWFSQSIHSSF